jgi:iron(III) transport system substrate-binding protein
MVLAACGGGTPSKSGAVSITLYNGQHPQTTQALVSAFERQTGIVVRERDGDELQLAQEIEQEGSSSRADVFYTENTPSLESLRERGLLAVLPPSALAAVPSQYSSSEGYWLGVSARVSALVYNTSQLKPADLPTSVLGLADPKWKGKLALAPGETDFQPIVTAVEEAVGRSAALTWLKAVKANAAAHIEGDNETLTADVNSGQAALGLINTYYWNRLAKAQGSSNVQSATAFFAARDPGYVLDVSGAAVLKSSKHQAAADELVQFLDSASGQGLIAASDSFEYPLRAGVAAAPGLPPFATLQPDPISLSQLGDGSDALRLLQEAQLL